MTGANLRATMADVFGGSAIEELAREYGVIARTTARDLTRLVLAFVLNGGTHEAGRQCDVLRMYVTSGAKRVVRSTFYEWFTTPLERLLTEMLRRAMAHAATLALTLPKALAGQLDWWIFDSTVVRLPDVAKLLEAYPGCGDYAAVKVHKLYSIGLGNLVRYHFSPARDHDGPHLVLDESWRGRGLIADLAYVSIARLHECLRFNVRFIFRLKTGWKPRIDRIVRGRAGGFLPNEIEFPLQLETGLLTPENGEIDADVTFDNGANEVHARLVGFVVPGGGLHLFLTDLPRETHAPSLVSEIYRVRWEIEIDNRVDKSGARLDEIDAEKPVSVRIMLLASLINATLARIIVHREHVALRVEMAEEDLDEPTRPPLHPILVLRAMATMCALVETLVREGQNAKGDAAPDDLDVWNAKLRDIRALGHDPNWRRRPSVLDRLLGLTGKPARKRREKLVAGDTVRVEDS